MSDTVDITKRQTLPEIPPPEPSPVQEQAARLDPPQPESVNSVRPTGPASDTRPPTPAPPPVLESTDSLLAAKLAAPVSTAGGNNNVTADDVGAIVREALKGMTVNGFSVDFSSGNLSIPSEAFFESRPSSLRESFDQNLQRPQPLPQQNPQPQPQPPSAPPQPQSQAGSSDFFFGRAENRQKGEDYVDQVSREKREARGEPPPEKPFSFGRAENRREGEDYIDQVSREKREARGEPPPPEKPFSFGREENRREGESYVDQVSREKKGDREPPSSQAASSTEPQEKQSPAFGGGTESRPTYGLSVNRQKGESYSDQVTREHKEDKDRRREDPSERQKGETLKEYKERMAEAKKIGSDKASGAMSLGDTTFMNKGSVPVRLKRADGEKTIIAWVSLDYSGVVEGATGNEKSIALPPESSFYDASGGGGGGCVGLGLFVKTIPPSTPQGNPTYQVWVNPGLVAGELPSGMDNAEGKIIAGSGSGDVWAEVNVSQQTGEVTSVAVTGGSSTPANSDTAYYLALGYYEFQSGEPPTITNYGCGSVDVRVCRNWFAAASPYYGVSLTRY